MGDRNSASADDPAGISAASEPPFPKIANAVTRYLLLGFLGFLIVGSYVWYAVVRNDYQTGVNQPVDQPVLFSHRHHAGDLGIDCRYCHTSVDDSAFAGIPPTETCMTCHSQIFTDSPMLAPVRESYRTGKPIAWNRVHQLPGHVYFDHSIHIANGIECMECHGDVADMALTQKHVPLFMDWCVSCHRKHEPTAAPKPNQPIQQGSEHSKEMQFLNHPPINQLTNCSTCHR